jgi:hypothetical protein
MSDSMLYIGDILPRESCQHNIKANLTVTVGLWPNPPEQSSLSCDEF